MAFPSITYQELKADLAIAATERPSQADAHLQMAHFVGGDWLSHGATHFQALHGEVDQVVERLYLR